MENRVYRRVGDSETRRFLGRFVFSTNKELSGLVRRGKFREDLYTRVNVLRVVMPPLRRILREAPDERREYVHGFTAETLPQSPETWDGWAYRTGGENLRATEPLDVAAGPLEAVTVLREAARTW